jgi:CDGSH-type Zn-finger protein
VPTGRTEPTRVTITSDGPILVDGPVELVGADGTAVRSDRFRVAVCTCRRSKVYPLCDTSHRKRVRNG